MVMIRHARAADLPQIKSILKSVDEDIAAQSWDNFRVAEKSGIVVGIVKIDEYKDYCFLSSLALQPSEQNQGIASFLMAQSLAQTKKDVYIYTIIPEFFRRFGFAPTAPPPFLPKKDKMECARCHPALCVCMVKRHAA
ncbi:MAG: GNAT family N-acetyltransferase [Candidatus Margulisiibacteriota bacterium]